MPLRPAPGIEIPDDELLVRTSRSGGPGGQHVNKSATRVSLRFDVVSSPSIPEAIRARLIARLGRRLAADGSISVHVQDTRSQHANRKLAAERLEAVLARALVRETPRVATSVPRAQKKRRLETKKKRAAIKGGRGRVRPRNDGD